MHAPSVPATMRPDRTQHSVYIRPVFKIAGQDERASPFALDSKSPGCIRGFCILAIAVAKSDALQSN
jgi:hypothetical protein